MTEGWVTYRFPKIRSGSHIKRPQKMAFLGLFFPALKENFLFCFVLYLYFVILSVLDSEQELFHKQISYFCKKCFLEDPQTSFNFIF